MERRSPQPTQPQEQEHAPEQERSVVELQEARAEAFQTMQDTEAGSIHRLRELTLPKWDNKFTRSAYMLGLLMRSSMALGVEPPPSYEPSRPEIHARAEAEPEEEEAPPPQRGLLPEPGARLEGGEPTAEMIRMPDSEDKYEELRQQSILNFQRNVEDAMERGYDISPSAYITGIDTHALPDQVGNELTAMFMLQATELAIMEKFSNNDPNELLQEKLLVTEEPERQQTLKVEGTYAVAHVLEDGSIQITFENWLKDEPIFTSDPLPAEKQNLMDFADWSKEVQQAAMEAVVDGAFDFTEEVVEAYEEKEVKDFLSVTEKASHTGIGKLAQDFSISLYTRDYDRVTGDKLSFNRQIIDEEFLETTESRPIAMEEGPIEAIRFGRTLKSWEPGYDALIAEPEVEKATDPHGNLVVVERLMHGTYNDITEAITVLPVIAFDPEVTSEEHRPVNLDLRGIVTYDLVLENYLEQRNEAPVERLEGGKDVYATISHERAKEFIEPMKLIAQGSASAERMFGLEPGELVSNLVISDANDPNATFSQRSPEAIVLFDEIIGRDPVMDEFVGAHETFHAIDHKYNIASNAFLELAYDGIYVQSFEEFFDTINEDHFYGTELGGHSEDNVVEFFASMMNTYRHPDWEAKVMAMDPDVRYEYINTTEYILKALNQSVQMDGMNENAPILAELEAKLDWMEKEFVPQSVANNQ